MYYDSLINTYLFQQRFSARHSARSKGFGREKTTLVFVFLWLMGTEASIWAYTIHRELCYAGRHTICQGLGVRTPTQPPQEAWEQKCLPRKDRKREYSNQRRGYTDVHRFPRGGNNKCKGPGARVGEGVHGISGERKRGQYELM